MANRGYNVGTRGFLAAAALVSMAAAELTLGESGGNEYQEMLTAALREVARPEKIQVGGGASGARAGYYFGLASPEAPLANMEQTRVDIELGVHPPPEDPAVFEQAIRTQRGMPDGVAHAVDVNGLRVDVTRTSLERGPRGGLLMALMIWRRGTQVVRLNVGANVRVVERAEQDRGEDVKPEVMRQRAEAALSALEQMAVSIARRLDAQLGGEYKIEAKLAVNTSGPAQGKPAFPLRIHVEVKRKRPGTNQFENMRGERIPLCVECEAAPGHAGNFLEFLRYDCLVRKIDMGRPNERYEEITLFRPEHAVFDAGYRGEPYRTNYDGTLEIPLASFGERLTVADAPGRAPQGDYRLDYGLLADSLSSWLRTGKAPGMMVRVYAAPALAGSDKETKKRFADFSVASQAVTVTVDRIADIEKPLHHESDGARSTVVVRRAETATIGYQWQEITSFPFPLLPMDMVSLGREDGVLIRWVDGALFCFKANPAAMSRTGVKWGERVKFWISPTQASDWLDRANYPGHVGSCLGVLRSSDPSFAVPVSAVRGTGESLIVKSLGGAVNILHRCTFGLIWTGVQYLLPTPVIYGRIESTAVFGLTEGPEIFLTEGKLVLLDAKGQPQQELSPGRVLRFDEKWSPRAPVAFAESELPAGTAAMLKSVGELKPEAPASAAAAGGPRTLAWWHIAAAVGIVLVAAAVVVLVAEAARGRRSSG
jgi:hypothetical protein